MKKTVSVIFAVAVIFLLRTYIGKAYKLPSISMAPTINQNERIFASMNHYKNHDISRGDVAIFIFPKDRSSHFCKRIVGFQGEEVKIEKKTLFINGEPLDESYAIYGSNQIERDFGPVVVPEGMVFFLGDNRDNSYDSRFFGSVPINDVLGKVKRIYWSKDKSRIWKEIE
jgi:signal peptidase I